jgi:hypothetical protein
MASGRCPGVVFPKLSKLLNQEVALSAPCLRGDFCSPQARPRGAQECCGQRLIRRCHIIVCCTEVIAPTSADAFPVAGGRCTGGARRCKAKQARRGRRPERDTYFNISMVFGLRRGVEDFFGNRQLRGQVPETLSREGKLPSVPVSRLRTPWQQEGDGCVPAPDFSPGERVFEPAGRLGL